MSNTVTIPAQATAMSRPQRVSIARVGTASVLHIDNPPVNAISPEVVQGLGEALDAFERDARSEALIIACAGRTFVAGGDIASFDDVSFSAAPYNHFLARLEACSRPVVAALHGSVLGGGLELALACHWRIAAQGTQFGLPEVKLGLLPGSLGTQRLPRLVGVPRALDMISSGRTVNTREASEVGLIDHVTNADPQTLVVHALAFARSLAARDIDTRRLSRTMVRDASGHQSLLDDAKARAEGSRYPALAAIAQAVRASTGAFAEGEQVEARLFEQLRASSESKALRHLFFAQREAARVPGLNPGLPTRPVQRVGILGAGTMGRGIAMNFLNAGIPTVLVDRNEEAVNVALGAIRALYEASASKGKLRLHEVQRRMALLSGEATDTALADCDLVIEAVFEDMALKRSVCVRLGQICQPGAIIATNTSTLDVDELAAASGRPADVVGLHFFSPANVMRLLEVVRGGRTAPDVLATVMQLARRIGKVAVVSGVCHGFIGNRMVEPHMREAELLILEGAKPQEVDQAMERFGMAMGPCRMLDMAGIDVGAKTVIEQDKKGALPPGPYRVLVRRLYEMGRLGQKSGAGYYLYAGRTPSHDRDVDRVAAELAEEHGIVRRPVIAPTEIFERLFFPLVNEAARILEEGISFRGSDIDVVWTAGYGFPDFRGGPAFAADEIGLARIGERLSHYGRVYGDAHGFWTPCALLRDLAANGGRLSDWRFEA